MIDIEVFQDTGSITGGRGTPISVMSFDMKNSGSYDVMYYPTEETDGAPLIRPLGSGDQTVSFPVYTFFKINGDAETLKNIRFVMSMEEGPQADNTQLFYKTTNTYQTPAAVYDGSMMLLADVDGEPLTTMFYPNLSTSGPHLATTRPNYVSGGFPYYTNYFVTQVRVNKGTLVGNTAQWKLRLEAYEYEA